MSRLDKIEKRLAALEERLAPPDTEAAAPEPIEEAIVTLPESGDVNDFIYRHGHVHDRYGNCIKNRYGRRCGDDVGPDQEPEDPWHEANRQMARMTNDLAVALTRADLTPFTTGVRWSDMSQADKDRAYDVARGILKHAAVNW